VTVLWDPSTSTYLDPETGERWVYADPAAFDHPQPMQAPVYTSGAPPAPNPFPAPDPDAAGRSVVPGPPVDPSMDPEDGVPLPGELGIEGRRSFKVWQLVLAVLVAFVVGMAFNGATGSSGGGSAANKPTYALPPAAGSATATTAAGGATATTAAGGATATTAAGGTTATTAAGGTTATTAAPVAAGPATVLVPATQQAGNWTSPAFTIAGGTWNIGWAFQCTPAPATPPTFQIFVVTAGGTPGSTPAVTSSAASGQSVTPLTSTGSQQVVVETSASCRWAVKVTGYSG